MRLNEGDSLPDADQSDLDDSDDLHDQVVSPAERSAFIETAMEDILWDVLPHFLTEWVKNTYKASMQDPVLLPGADVALLYRMCGGLLGDASVAGLEAELVSYL